MEKISVGLVGYGSSGSTFHAPIIGAVEALRLATVVSSNPEKVHRDLPNVQVVRETEELLGDPKIELVVIATPNALHYPLAKQALRAGKHVVVEKPFVARVEQADELLQLAAERNRVLSAYHNRRWDGDFQTLKRCIAEGLLGEVSTYEARWERFRPQVADRWKERDEEGAGVLYDLGSHLIDQALHLFGLPETVRADVGIQRTGGQVPDYFHLLLGYGVLRVILHGGLLMREPAFRYAVHGDRGSFVKHGLDPQEDALKQGRRPGEPEWGREAETQFGELITEMGGLPVRARVETLPGSYPSFYEGIVRSIRDGEPPPVSAADARNVIAIIESAVRSSREGRVVRPTPGSA